MAELYSLSFLCYSLLLAYFIRVRLTAGLSGPPPELLVVIEAFVGGGSAPTDVRRSSE